MNKSEIDVMKEFDDGSLVIECQFCEGLGIFPETPFDDDSLVRNYPCSVCNGKGFNVFQTTLENLLPCQFCDATGRGWDENGYFLGEVCQVCKGTGVILLEKEDTDIESLWSLMHRKIVSVAHSRFSSGHYADAVEAAFKEINMIIKKVVKEKIGEELDGVPAIEKAFSLHNPLIKLSDLSTESGRNIQKGYLQIFSGSILGIRNPKAHENIIIDRKQAIRLLFLASLLMSKIEKE
jgi:uncharacterized protein (TIGR02391 family)